MWEIIDNNGQIYRGSKRAMETIFQQIREGKINEKWSGNLRLVEVHDVIRERK